MQVKYKGVLITRNYYRKEVLPNRNFTLVAANRKSEKTFMALMNTSASK